MRRLPYREYRAKLEWLDQLETRPNKTDNYLMQLAGYLHNMGSILMGRSFQVELDQYEIKFTRDKDATDNDQPDTMHPHPPRTVEERTMLAKARWRARMGPPVESR